MARGSIATESLRRRGFHLETWVSRPLLALRICAPLGLSHGAFPQPGASALSSNVYTDAEGEAMNSPWSFAAPPANSTNPNQACKLWGLAAYPRLQGDGVQCNQLGCGGVCLRSPRWPRRVQDKGLPLRV